MIAAGVMAALMVDTMRVALDRVTEATSLYRGSALVWLGAAATALALLALGRATRGRGTAERLLHFRAHGVAAASHPRPHADPYP